MSARAVWAGQPLAFTRIAARSPTVVVGVGRVVATPEGIGLELVGAWRRIRGDRARRDPMNELFVAVRRPDGMREPAQGGAGSGRGGAFRQGWSIGPPPPEGDLALLISLPSHDIVEAELAIPGDALREAAARAIRLWDA